MIRVTGKVNLVITVTLLIFCCAFSIFVELDLYNKVEPRAQVTFAICGIVGKEYQAGNVKS